MPETQTAAPPEGGGNPRTVAWIVAAAFFMGNLDGTVIVTALPAIAGDFGVEPVALSIGVTAYLLALAAVLPASGWVADRYGTRNVFAAALLVFTLASVLCAMAESLYPFVAARVLQGVGGALMAPVGRLAVLRNTKNSELLQAIATITWPALVAPVLGPPLGGFITQYASWEWIFLLNLPIGLAGLVLTMIYIPNHRGERRIRFDLLGFVLSATGLVLLLAGLENVAHGGARAILAAGMAVAGALIGWIAIRHFRKAAAPLVDLEPLGGRIFAVTAVGAGMLVRIAINATPFLMPLAFQLGFGLDPLTSGLLVLAYMGGNLVMKSVTTPTLRRFGFRNVLVVNAGIIAASIGAMALLGPTTPIAAVVVLLFGAGLVRSMQFTSLTSLSFSEVPQRLRAAGSTLFSTAQQVSQTLGIALGASLLTLSQTLRGADSVALADFRSAFIVTGLIALVSMFGFLKLPADAGAEVSGHRPAKAAD
jgi:EmrB/QacA subfamily drug resistance transporter